MSGTSENTLPAPECASCKDGRGSSKCASCPSASQEKQAQKSAMEQQIAQRLSKVKHRIAVVSGKGGVGKSTVTASLALNLSMLGKKVGVLDADVSGPNMPHLLGLEGRKLEASTEGLEPIINRNGIRVISSEFVLTTSDTPMLWRGPMRTTLVTQFVTDTNWGELDYLLIDLPPGTGDEPMSVMQLIPLDGIIIV
ncbi:MAG TPA: P-loop NTPase, partial [Methanocella sp.]|nr:P-loop NTPase [Methanocella sp.]